MNCSRSSEASCSRCSFLGRLLGGFRHLSGPEKLLLVAASVGRPDERQADRQRLAVRIPPLARIGDHLQRLPVGLDHVDREFLERALHPQQRRDVGFVVDPARHRQEFAESLSDHLVRGVAGPAQKGAVHMFDRGRLAKARRTPHGAFSIMSSKSRSGSVHGGQTKVRIAAMTSSGALRLGQWPVAFRTIIRLFGNGAVDEVADLLRGDDVFAALEDQRRHVDAGEVLAIVGGERHAGEGLGDLRIGAAEAVGQLLAQLGPVRIAHDRRRHLRRPAHVIGFQKLQQLLDLLRAEAADISFIVDVAGRGTDQHQLAEHARRLLRRRARRSCC